MKILIALLILFPFNLFASETDLIPNVYKTFEEKYIKKNVIPNLAISTIKALNTIDKNILISDDNSNIGIYYKTKKITLFNKPKNNNYKPWAELTKKIIDKTLELSPILQKKEFEITDILLSNSINSLPDKSRYYPVINDKKTIEKHKQTFRYNIDKDNKLTITAKNINEVTYNSIKDIITNNPQATSLVLDLSDNSGGELKSAINIINLFVDEGIIFTTRDTNGITKIFQADKGDAFEYKPIFIIVNKNTASSAELIAYSLSNQNRAKVIGNKTYGKNSVQTLFIIEGRGLTITTEYFYDPEGNHFHF